MIHLLHSFVVEFEKKVNDEGSGGKAGRGNMAKELTIQKEIELKTKQLEDAGQTEVECEQKAQQAQGQPNARQQSQQGQQQAEDVEFEEVK